MRSRWVYPALVGSGLVLLVATAVVFWSQRDDSLSRLRDGDTIRIGYAVEAPYAFVDPAGKVTGEAPAIAKVITKRLDLGSIAWRQLEFDALIDALGAGRIDVVAAGMFITPERAELVAFSSPTCRVAPALLVRRGNPNDVRSYQQLVASPEARVAVLDGSVEEILFYRMGLADRRLVRVPDVRAGREAVEGGEVTALAVSAPTARWMANREGAQTEPVAHLDPLPGELTEGLGFGAFAFRRVDRALRRAWNAAMAEFIGSPEHLKLATKFRFQPAEQPGGVTVEEILNRL